MFTKFIIAGATLLTLGTAPLVPANMTYIYSYLAECQLEVPEGATTTPEDTRPYIPDCKNGYYAVSVFSDYQGNYVYVEIPENQYRKMQEKEGYFLNPKKVDLMSIFEALANIANGAIVYDSYAPGTGSAPPGSISTSFPATTTSPDAGIVVMGLGNDLTDTCRDVKYNGVTMTWIDEQTQAGGGGRTERLTLHYNIATTTGVWNVTINCTGGMSNELTGQALSYTGVNQTAMLNNAKRRGGSATTSLAIYATTSVDGTWAVTGARDDSGSLSNGTNFTIVGGASSINIGDSAASLGAAGGYTVQLGGASGNIMMITAVIAPAAGSAPPSESTTTPVMRVDGNVQFNNNISITF